MFAPHLEMMISSAGAPVLTEVFICLLISVLLLSLALKKLGKLHDFTLYTPTLLTSLGMLGTFTGIVAGLLEFDTTNIDTSIELLLAGLKTAFITSLVGMLFSIFFKGVSASGLVRNKSEDSDSPENITPEHLYSVMQLQVEAIHDLKKSIGADNESSLVGQFKLLRSDITDGQRNIDKSLNSATDYLSTIKDDLHQQQSRFSTFEENLWLKLTDFADMLSKSATEQVIEALKSVIQDFNNNLTEQFGDNFKQLNQAVMELVTWQENYKQQLDAMKAQYDQGVQAIEKTETSVAHISERTQAIPEAMDQLKAILAANQHQIEELARHLDSFASIRDKAVEAIPEIHKQIEEAIDGARQANNTMSKGVLDSTDTLVKSIIGSAENLEVKIATSAEGINKGMTGSTTKMVESINSSTENLITEISGSASDLKNGVNECTEALVKSVTASAKTTEETISSSLDKVKEGVIGSSDVLVKSVTSSSNALEVKITGTAELIEKGLKDSADILVKSVTSSAENLSGKITDSARKYEDAVNNTKESVTQIASEITASTGKINEQFIETSKTLKTESNNLVNELKKGNKELSNSFDNTKSEILHTQKQLTEETRNSAKKQIEEANTIFKALETNLKKTVKTALEKTTESVESQVKAINEATEKHVQRITQSMANALTTITEKFTSDYKKLVSEMANILRYRPSNNE